MGKLSIVMSGCTLALTFALLNSACAAVVAVWPTQAIAMANAWAHGFDLQLIRASSPLTWVSFLSGLIGISAVGFIFGAVFAAIHNYLGKFFRARE